MNKWMVPLIGVLLILSACTGQQGANEKKVNADTKANHHVSSDERSVDVIPSYNRDKKLTTNEEGNTTSGIGQSVYSLIGSSSLHDGGISSHLESRLSGAGIPGIKVFVLDDTVILARAKQENTSTKYDDMQNQVLSGTNGESGKGQKKGVNDIDNNTDDNMEHAKKLMSDSFDGNVQILTITNPNALDLIDRIKANIKSDNPSYGKLNSDMTTLIKMTREKS